MVRRVAKAWAFWCGGLGFALGGFFDGILLHQILQWHHLLSLVPSVVELRTQVLWDGYFHALMYLIACVALLRLWWLHRGHEGRPVVAPLLIGFGLWHVVDTVLSHWLLGIHRIRTDSDNPLFWDLLWLVAFGLVPIVIGWFLKPPKAPKLPSNIAGMMAGLTVLALGAGIWAMQPPPGQSSFTTVVFGGQHPMEQAFDAIALTDARLVWSTPDMGVAVLDLPASRKGELYRQGAILVSGSSTPPGCFAWSRP